MFVEVICALITMRCAKPVKAAKLTDKQFIDISKAVFPDDSVDIYVEQRSSPPLSWLGYSFSK